jgi:hypothetical protein
MAGCGSGGTKAANPDDLAVAVASYDLATGPPTRFIVGILTVDQRLLGYGSVDLRFSFLGSKQGGGGGPFGPAVRATYLPIYGSTVPSPAPATPQIVAESDTRGVYGSETTFDKAGFWQVLASTTIDGKLRKGTGAFQVSPTHAVPAPATRPWPPTTSRSHPPTSPRRPSSRGPAAGP